MSDLTPPPEDNPFASPQPGSVPPAPVPPAPEPPAYGSAPPPAPSYGTPPPPPAYGTPPPPPGYGTPPPPPGYGTPQMPYGAVAPGYGSPYAVQRTSGRATAVMVLGIVGIVMFCAYGIGLVCAIVALVLAPGARREIEQSGGMIGGAGMVKAGVICAWVAVGLSVLVIGIIVIAAIASSNTTHY